MSSELKYLHALNSIPGIGPATLRHLKSYFGSYESAWTASEGSLKESGITSAAHQAFIWKRPSLSPDRELGKLLKENVWVITEEDNIYPSSLREIPQPPVLIYGRGDVKTLKGKSLMLGVVGTRRPTSYGLEVTEKITQELVESGAGVVSGLAMGIDARAHETTLNEKGFTIAVLGSGLDQNSIFPPENRGLAKRIVDAGGLLLSEYAPGTPAVKEHFPQRNRILAGLSRGVVVVEARERSGALITARLALEQNREVFAVPGPLFSAGSRGPHSLIKQGAKLIESAQDILEELGIEYNKEREARVRDLLSEHERLILEGVEEPTSVDELKEKTGFPTSLIVTSLSSLELKGIIKNLGQDIYQKIVIQ